MSDLEIKQVGEYDIVAFIQDCYFSTVYELSHPKKCGKYAVKLIKRDKTDLSLAVNEIEINKEIDSDYIMPIIDVVENVSDKYICGIIMVKATGTDLLEVILQKKKLPESLVAQVAYSILKALQYLHKMGICHRDIKPDNIFLMDEDLNDPDIVLGDFGHATHFNDNEKMTNYTVGSPLFVAPEIVLCNPYDKSVDIWSLGCVIFSCFTGCFPFSDPYYIVQGSYSFDPKIWGDNEKFKDFVSSMLRIDPNTRATIDDLLAHSWLTENYVANDKKVKRREKANDKTNPEQQKDPYDQ